MLVSDRHNGIFNTMEAIFPDAAHGIYVYHLAQNLKRFCKQRDDVMWLYYCAAYAYHIEDFDRFMAEDSLRKMARTRGLKQKTTPAGRRTVGSMPGISISEAQAAEEAVKKRVEVAALSSKGKEQV
ncbi:hypothetical protein LWI29_011564 [Acer saccharum]|uniref:MULE transposase domain-containing protein n=1 Tax=Acer saccharum TaxID=4024 RepID=A0AA39VDD7_ACESA|nr:hypothetical protein LWI29_011564 [Acer saccharum]